MKYNHGQQWLKYDQVVPSLSWHQLAPVCDFSCWKQKLCGQSFKTTYNYATRSQRT
jgi:hypothetical protein